MALTRRSLLPLALAPIGVVLFVSALLVSGSLLRASAARLALRSAPLTDADGAPFGGSLLPPLRPLALDAEALAHGFDGFGVGLHPADVKHRELLAELGVSLVRMEVGPSWNHLETKIPTDVDDRAMDAYIRANFDADSPHRLSGARWAFKVLREQGAEVVLVNFELPWHWLAKDDFWRTLEEDHVDDLVRFWCALLLFLKQQGMVPGYIELANEPDGNWNGHVPPERYRRLLVLARSELDRRGLGQVKILGPGLAFLRREGVAGRWLAALDRGAAACLWGWSTHVWDEVDYRRAQPEFVHGIWREFLDGIAPHGPKPLWVTEYATEVTQFEGRTYHSPRDNKARCSADAPAYGTRAVVNSLIHLNRGASGLIFYRLADHDWDDTTWGLLRRDGSRRPAINALKCVFPHVPRGARLLAPRWHARHDPITTAAWLAPSRLVVSCGNVAAWPVARQLALRGLPWRPRAEARLLSYADGELTERRARLSPDGPGRWTLDAEVPRSGLLTLIITPETERDDDGR